MSSNAETLPARVPRHRIPQSMMLPVEPYYRPRSVPRVASGLFVFSMVVMFAMGFPAWIIAGSVGMFVLMMGSRREGAAAIAKNQRAIDLLNTGNVHDAAREFEQLARTQTRQAAHAVYVFNRAVAYLLEGRLQRAMSLFNAIDHSNTFERGPNRSYALYLHVEMASCLALMGMLPEANAHRERAIVGLEPSETYRFALVDAVMALRRRDPMQALRSLDLHWDEAFDGMRPPSFRGLMVLRAFALQALNQEGAQFQSLMRATVPLRPGEFDYLGVQWPEMKAFLVQHKRFGGVRRA